MKKTTLFMLLGLATSVWAEKAPSLDKSRNITLLSPNGQTTVRLLGGDTLALEVSRAGERLTTVEGVCLQMDGGRTIGVGKQKAQERTGVKEHIVAPFYRQQSFDVEFNELTLTGKHGGVTVRAYDEGVAYRFFTTVKGDYRVEREGARFQFDEQAPSWLSFTTNEKRPFAMAFQNYYTDVPVGQQDTQLPAFLPATVGGKCKLTLLESDLKAYPGMFLQHRGKGCLEAVFAPYPKTTDYYPGRKQQYVTSAERYIARCTGARTLPWRVMAITEQDTEMPTNNLVYALAEPNRIGDCSWVRPGKVAWDWWNDWGLEGVDFKAGVNNRTYEYYIDFAAVHGLEYVVLDEGWYAPKSGNMLNTIPEIDLPELVAYAKKKGVDLILWTVFNVLDDQLEEACEKYARMGIKGFKVDFLDRDDQTAVEMIYRIAEACARHKMMLDYHGIFKPTGLCRTYPNVVNYEACFGMEEVKWKPEDKDMTRYDVTMPYIRGMAGYVDFTPGAMRNATKADWRPVYYHPMSQGTRCHQAAMYVCFDSPLTMLADSPTEYKKDENYTQFIAAIPTDFVETKILAGEIGKYIVVARRDREGNVYVGGMTAWDGPRSARFDLSSMLDAGTTYEVERAVDGVNAAKTATDYQLGTSEVTGASAFRQEQQMAPGGGFVQVYHVKK